MNEKDKHVEVICKKYEIYKSIMENEFQDDDYPYYNLEPWTNYYVEDEKIDDVDLEFENYFDENFKTEE